MARTRIKICGLTREADIFAAASLGVDAIGLVFCRVSSRFVEIEQAVELVRAVPPFVTTVGLFMDNTADDVSQVLSRIPLDVLQFHGAEDAAFCRQFGRAYMKALPMKGDVDVRAYATSFPDALGFFADSHSPGQAGGTGQAFDWSRYPGDLEKPVILAGGLTPQNVAQAVRQTRPYGVDVSSGVEVEKGVKNVQKMAEFVSEVNRVRHEE